jgi:hypothetical protein
MQIPVEAELNQVCLRCSARQTTQVHCYQGIEANPEKITAITDMDAPQTIKDV